MENGLQILFLMKFRFFNENKEHYKKRTSLLTKKLSCFRLPKISFIDLGKGSQVSLFAINTLS